jgi:hypothetical protein
LVFEEASQGSYQRRAFAVGADSDAQGLVDPGQPEVADDDAAITQGLGQSGCVVLRVAGENEVGGRGQGVEAEAGEFGRQRFAGGDDGAPTLLEVRLILQGGDSADDGEAVERMRIAGKKACFSSGADRPAWREGPW